MLLEEALVLADFGYALLPAAPLSDGYFQRILSGRGAAAQRGNQHH
jgi:hypothetical protein